MGRNARNWRLQLLGGRFQERPGESASGTVGGATGAVVRATAAVVRATDAGRAGLVEDAGTRDRRRPSHSAQRPGNEECPAQVVRTHGEHLTHRTERPTDQKQRRRAAETWQLPLAGAWKKNRGSCLRRSRPSWSVSCPRALLALLVGGLPACGARTHVETPAPMASAAPASVDAAATRPPPRGTAAPVPGISRTGAPRHRAARGPGNHGAAPALERRRDVVPHQRTALEQALGAGLRATEPGPTHWQALRRSVLP